MTLFISTVYLFLCIVCFKNASCLEQVLSQNPECLIRKERGPCLAYFIRYYYNSEVNECVRFLYGGCKGNRNRFRTKRRCEFVCKVTEDEMREQEERAGKAEACEAVPDTGPCRAHLIRYYYSQETDQCAGFIFGGCLGNRNNYDSKELCESNCKKTTNIEEDSHDQENITTDCSSLQNTGPCRAQLIRYHYSNKFNQCIQFIYGGCQGNENNYVSKEDCESACMKQEGAADDSGEESNAPSDCTSPKDIGPCRALFTRYYYDSVSNQCIEFEYGGCHGNGNNYLTKQQCESFCKRNV